MRIAISTGGGDAPGLNAVIRAATLSASRRGWETIGIRDSFNGLMFPEEYPNGGMIELTRDLVRGIGHLGGTILGSTNRGNPTAFPVQQDDGTWTTVDRTEELVGLFREAGIDALVTIGGDGSLSIGRHLSDAGMRVMGVPKTIDNDLDKTDATFGFDSAVEVATESIDRLFTTATSHSRVFVVEVMGRYAGWIALNAGVAAGVHAILIPEIPFVLEPVAEMIARREARGRDSPSSWWPKGRNPETASAPSSARLTTRRSASAASGSWWRPSSSGSPGRRPARSCSGTCSGAERPRRSIVCSGRGSAPPPCAASKRVTVA